MRPWHRALTICCAIVLSNGCKTANHRDGAEFFAARDRVDNPDAMSQEWRAQWIEANTYRSTSELPEAKPDDSCEMMHILIELPAIGTGLEVGHTGVAIADEYFDYGPAKAIEKSATRLSAEGGPYWDNPESWPGARSTDEVNFLMVRATISSLAYEHTVLLVPVSISKEHAATIRKWWKNTYDTKPTYNIPGMHCTSSVIRSIEESDPLRASGKNPLDQRLITGASAVTSPLKYAQILLGNVAINTGRFTTTHSCGALRGKPLKAAVINVGTDLGQNAERLLMKNP